MENMTSAKKHKSFYAHCRMAISGFFKSQKILKKYRLMKPEGHGKCILVLPYSDPEVAYFSLLYLDEIVKTRGLDSAVLITDSDAVITAANKMCVTICDFKKTSAKVISNLISFYSTTFFSDRFYIASLDEPFARHGELFVGKHGITVENAVVSGIYGIVDYFPKHRFDDVNETDIEIRKIYDSGINK